MSPLQWLQLLAALASALAAGLVWALRDASPARKDLLAAKDQELEAVKRERDALRELTPLKIREFLLTARRQLKDYCDLLDQTYDRARRDLAQCDAELARRQGEGSWNAAEAKALILQREQLTLATQAMKGGLRGLQQQCEYPDNLILKFPAVNAATLERLTAQCVKLAGPSEPLATLSATLQATFLYRLDANTLFSNLPFAPGLEQTEVWQRPDNGE